MKRSIRKKIEEKVENQLNDLDVMTPGSEEHSAAVHDIADMCKVLDSSDQWFWDIIAKYGVEIGLGLVTLVAYGAWYDKGLHFETEGTVTSNFFRNLLAKFKPTR